MNCTWVECDRMATVSRIAEDGEVWARLCDEHNRQFNDIDSALIEFPSRENAKRMIGAWVRAQGGAKAATDRAMNWVSENPPRRFS